MFCKQQNMFHRKEHSLKLQQHQELEHLKFKLNEQLRVISSTQQNFNPERSRNSQLPYLSLEQSVKSKTDRITSERLKYQHNLNSIIVEIRKKMTSTQRGDLKSLRINIPKQDSRITSRKQQTFKIRSLNLSPNYRQKKQFQRSYLEPKCHRRYLKQKRYQRFDFQPWLNIEDSMIQTIQL